MNLLELYEKAPRNYFICADPKVKELTGGMGKTSMMKYLEHEICGKEVHGKIVIPIYVKMSECNSKSVDSDVLYQYVLKHYRNHVTKKAIMEMFETSSTHRFLFLLDGINEVNNYVLPSGLTVYDCLAMNIKELIQYENVHVIMTSRMNHELDQLFETRYLCALEHEQYRRYLQMKEDEILPETLARLCKNPMLLRMFKCVYENDREAALSLKTRYDLIGQYFLLDTEYKKNPEWNDHLLKVRKVVIETIYPYIAFNYECKLKKVFEVCDVPRNITVELIDKVIRMMGILDEELNFQHEIIQDYFTVQGFLQRWEYAGARNDVKVFLEELRQNMKYDSSLGMDYQRRTKDMDFCEFLYAARGKNLESYLKKCNLDDAQKLAFYFYYDLAGLYKDLIQPELAEEVGSIAVQLLMKMEVNDSCTAFFMADAYNYLGYCLVKIDDSIKYLERAKTILEENDDLSKKEKRLMGRILSNMGAYYYARRDFESAMRWHRAAMEYRQEKDLREDMIHSCRTLMSDYYMLKLYDKAYECYLKGLEFLEEGIIDLEFEERAMGSEIELLKMETLTEVQRTELMERLVQQIQIVYEGATASHRKNRNLLESLSKKLCQLEVFMDVSSYQELCSEALRGV